jgi:chromosome partitioning protein
VFLGRVTADDVIIEREGPDLLPSSIDLAGSEIHLLTKTGREFVLARALTDVRDRYDIVLIDCGPSLGILTVNALTAADSVLIPFQAETLSDRGVGQLLETINDVRHYTNEHLGVLGGIATMFDARTNLGKRVLEEVREVHGLDIIEPPIQRRRGRVSPCFVTRAGPAQRRPIARSRRTSRRCCDLEKRQGGQTRPVRDASDRDRRHPS